MKEVSLEEQQGAARSSKKQLGAAVPYRGKPEQRVGRWLVKTVSGKCCVNELLRTGVEPQRWLSGRSSLRKQETSVQIPSPRIKEWCNRVIPRLTDQSVSLAET